MEHQAQMEMSQKLIEQLDTNVHRLTDDIIDAVFKDQELVKQLAHDVVNAVQRTPLDAPLHLGPIFMHRLRQYAEARIAAALDKHLKPGFGPYVTVQPGAMPDELAYTLPTVPPRTTNLQEGSKMLRKALVDKVIDYAAIGLQAHTGK